MKNGYVYFLANKRNGTLYLGVTSNLQQRVWRHKEGIDEKAFSKKYGVKQLVWYEAHDDIAEAIKREKAMKKWNRQWKLRLIEAMNPQWNDLYQSL